VVSAQTREWARHHPIRVAICALCLVWLALIALSVAIGGAASATQARTNPGVTKITAKFDRQNKDLFFDGPATVAVGDMLKILNKTNPRSVGPHTFSLVDPDTLPESRDEIKACSKKLKGICGAIARWHKADPETGQVAEPHVNAGRPGWDTPGSLKRKGDSVVLSRHRGEWWKFHVRADPGETLYYICAVHASMQGKIQVVEGS
jgi:plastocyanin